MVFARAPLQHNHSPFPPSFLHACQAVVSEAPDRMRGRKNATPASALADDAAGTDAGAAAAAPAAMNESA